jgi:hypothetical protein
VSEYPPPSHYDSFVGFCLFFPSRDDSLVVKAAGMGMLLVCCRELTMADTIFGFFYKCWLYLATPDLDVDTV